MKQVSVNNLHECTEQEVFDFVANHLLTQNETSTNGRNCLYRSLSNGKQLMCAAGCLIPDNIYDPNIAHMSWKYAYGKTYPTHSFLIEGLQLIHDFNEPYEWCNALNELAISNGLSTKILEQFA